MSILPVCIVPLLQSCAVVLLVHVRLEKHNPAQAAFQSTCLRFTAIVISLSFLFLG